MVSDDSRNRMVLILEDAARRLAEENGLLQQLLVGFQPGSVMHTRLSGHLGVLGHVRESLERVLVLLR